MPAIDALPLLERESELALLERLIAEGSGTAERLIVIEGAPGLGKSRLLGEARAVAAAAGYQVLSARGSELEREFGFGVVRQLFERPIGRLAAPARAEVLSGAAAPAAAVLGADAPAEATDVSFATLHGLYWVTANLAERQPLLLAVDDLHWCDAGSLRWLAYLVGRLEGLAVVLAVALRPSDPGGDAALLAHVTQDPRATLLRPSPLSRGAAADVVRAALADDADPAFCVACHEESGGNPLLLGQLLSAVAAEGLAPTAGEVGELRRLGANAVADVVALRLARLPDAAVRLAEAVAVLGDGVDLRLAATLAELGDAAALSAAEALARCDILRREFWLAFVHPMVRAAVRERIASPDRAHAHMRAARLLRDAGAPVEAVAAQLLLAPPSADAAAAATLLEAARRALPRGAAESAIAYMRRALAEPPPAEDRYTLLVELATAEIMVDGAAAERHFEEARAAARNPQELVRVAQPLSATLYLLGRTDDALGALDRALHRLGPGQDELRLGLDIGRLHIGVTAAAHYPLAVELLERLPETVDHQPSKMLLAAYRGYHEAYAAGSRERTLEHAARAQADGLLFGPFGGTAAWAAVALALMAADEDAAARFVEASHAATHRSGSVLALAAVKVFGARLALLLGAPADAEASAREGLRACEAWGLAFGEFYAGAHLADALMEQGRLDEAAAALAFGAVEPVEFTATTSWYLDARARLTVLQGDLQTGIEQLLALGRGFAALGGRNPAFLPWRSEAALALLRAGDVGRARELASEELKVARGWGAPRALGRALRVAGLVEGGERGLALAAEAVEVLAGSPARLEHAKALVDLGAALRRANRRTDAREPLRRGLELATVCGAGPVGERAETELLATGARLGRVALSGVGSLTPSERRVAELAAAGASNREIAQALFVTIKTVEVHLRNAYRKLDIASRAQLPSALGEPAAASR